MKQPKIGRWTPGLQNDLSQIAMLALSLEIIVRGFDYLTGDRNDVTSNLSIVENALPLPLWGAILLVGGFSFIAGVVWRRFGLIIFGSVVTMACYMALACGLFLKMAERGWPWDGFRTPLMFVVYAGLFGLFALSAYLKRAALQAEDHLRGEIEAGEG